MPRLPLTLLVTIVVFGLVLTILGSAMGTPGLLIWTVLLFATLGAEVVQHRRQDTTRSH